MKSNFIGIPDTANSEGRQLGDRCWILNDAEATIALGVQLIEKIPAIKILFLQGPLGAGKTTLVKGIAKSLGILEPITSPSFALSQHYLQESKALVHIDLYRLEDEQAADQLFLQEEEEAHKLGAIMIIEWPERLGIKIHDAWKLRLSYHNSQGRFAQLESP